MSDEPRTADPAVGDFLDEAKRMTQSLVDAAYDRWFERRYSVSTGSWQTLSDLDAVGVNGRARHLPQPAGILNVRRSLERVPKSERGTLVDFGSGLGRVLFAANLAGYCRAVGVESARHLCEGTEENVRAFCQVTGASDRQFEVVHADATSYHVLPDQCVFAFFEPFRADIVPDVLDNIIESASRSPRPVWLLFGGAIDDQLARDRRFRHQFTERWGGTECRALRLSPGPAPDAPESLGDRATTRDERSEVRSPQASPPESRAGQPEPSLDLGQFSSISARVRRYFASRSPGETARDLRSRAPLMARWAIGMVYDNGFDRRHGVDTAGEIKLEHLEIESASRSEGNLYDTPPARSLRRLFDRLPLDPQGRTLIDFGSGKGRVLLIASEYPFSRIIGVEFAAELHEIAAQNVRRVRKMRQRCCDIEVVLADAAQYEIPPGPLLVYLFAPFGPEVLRRVLDRVEASYRIDPREMHVLYLTDPSSHPMPEGTILSTGFWQPIDSARLPFDPAMRFPLSYKLFAVAEH